MNHPTDIALHRAAQYLAAFGINYLEAESDDSHTNLGWDTQLKALVSRSLDDGMHMLLHMEELKLAWVGKESFTLDLKGRTHGEICVWLHHIALRCGLIGYDFYLHYSLDSGKILPDAAYDGFDTARAIKLATLRTGAQKACESIRESYSLKTEIRIWPHHFDTGGYAQLPDMEISIGFGMAIPDTVMDDYYLYVSGYSDGKAIPVEGKAPLQSGGWKSGGFNGAIRGTSGADENVTFFKEAIDSYRQ